MILLVLTSVVAVIGTIALTLTGLWLWLWPALRTSRLVVWLGFAVVLIVVLTRLFRLAVLMWLQLSRSMLLGVVGNRSRTAALLPLVVLLLRLIILGSRMAGFCVSIVLTCLRLFRLGMIARLRILILRMVIVGLAPGLGTLCGLRRVIMADGSARIVVFRTTAKIIITTCEVMARRIISEIRIMIWCRRVHRLLKTRTAPALPSGIGQ